MGLYPCERLAPELILKNPNGFSARVITDTDGSHKKFKTRDLRFRCPLRNETNISGEVLLDRANDVEGGEFGLVEGKQILDERDDIPPHLRYSTYIMLLGTRVRDSQGRICVPFISWTNRNKRPDWYLSYVPLYTRRWGGYVHMPLL